MAADDDWISEFSQLHVPIPQDYREYHENRHLPGWNDDDEHIQWGVISVLDHINLGSNNITGRPPRPDAQRQKLIRDVIASCASWIRTNHRTTGSFLMEDIKINDGDVQLNVQYSDNKLLSESLLEFVEKVLRDVVETKNDEYEYFDSRIRSCNSEFDFQQLHYQPILYYEENSLFFIARLGMRLNSIPSNRLKKRKFRFLKQTDGNQIESQREHLERILGDAVFSNDLEGLINCANAIIHCSNEVPTSVRRLWHKILDLFPNIHLDIIMAIDATQFDLLEFMVNVE